MYCWDVKRVSRSAMNSTRSSIHAFFSAVFFSMWDFCALGCLDVFWMPISCRLRVSRRSRASYLVKYLQLAGAEYLFSRVRGLREATELRQSFDSPRDGPYVLGQVWVDQWNRVFAVGMSMVCPWITMVRLTYTTEINRIQRPRPFPSTPSMLSLHLISVASWVRKESNASVGTALGSVDVDL